MVLPEAVWTALFLLLAVGILIFFGLMIKRSLSHGSCCCSEKKEKSGEKSVCSHCCRCGEYREKKT